MPSLPKSFPPRDRFPGAEQISDNGRIRSIIRHLEAGRELLHVEVPGYGRQAISTIVGMREQSGVVYLDALDGEGHRALLRHRSLNITAWLRGTRLSFSSELLSARQASDGMMLYEVQIPGLILRAQRRDNFRLRLAPTLVVPIVIPEFDGESLRGEIYDMSTTGIGAHLQTRKVLSPGTLLSDIRLSLPPVGQLVTGVEIRFARRTDGRQLLRIGARFVGLDPAAERQIARFLAAQQRKRRRHRPR